MTSPRAFLSTMWIFLVLNYLYADLLFVMHPDHLRQMGEGYIGSLELTSVFFVGASLLVEIPILMVILSRVLPYRINRGANIAAAIVMILAQIGYVAALSILTISYAFFSIVAIGGLAVVAGYSWKWDEAGDTGQ